MAPVLQTSGQVIHGARRAILSASAANPLLAHDILRRSLSSPNSTQKVTLGVIAVYVVVIALLWNLPYVRWSLWPFKVS